MTADRRRGRGATASSCPGVGAFAACMAGLRAVRGDRIIDRRLAGGRPVLGICVGHAGAVRARRRARRARPPGCGEWPGDGRAAARPTSCRTWAGTPSTPPPGSLLFAGVEDERFYFVHSYGVRDWDAAAPTAAPRAAAGDLGRARRRRSSPRWRTGRCAPPSSTRRSPGTPGRTLLRNWVAHAVSAAGASTRPPRLAHAAARRRRRRRPGRPAVQGEAGTETALRRPAWRPRCAWQDAGARVDPPGRPRRRVRPRVTTGSCWPRSSRRARRRRSSCPAASATTTSLGARAGHRLRAGSTSAPRRWRTRSGRARRSRGTATGSPSASTSAARTLAARGWTREGGDLWEVLARLDADGCARYVVTDVDQGRHAARARTSTCCAQVVRRAPTGRWSPPAGCPALADLAALRRAGAAGVEGAIVGKALYAGAFTLPEALDVAGRP